MGNNSSKPDNRIILSGLEVPNARLSLIVSTLLALLISGIAIFFFKKVKATGGATVH